MVPCNWRFLVAVSFVILKSVTSQCYGQSYRVDSLNSMLPGATDERHIDILFEIGREHLNAGNMKGLAYIRESHAKAKQVGDSLRIVKTGRLLGQSLRRILKHDSAQIVFEQVLPIARRHGYRMEIKTILNALAVTYLEKAQHDEALKYFLKSLELREADRDEWEISVVLNNLGLVYEGLMDHEKALEHFDRSIVLKIKAGRIEELDFMHLNKSICLANLRRYSEAIDEVNRGLAICDSTCSDEIRLMAYQNLGLIAFFQGNLIEAKSHYLRSYKLSTISGYEVFHISNVSKLIQIHTALNELQFAEAYLKEAEALSVSGSSFSRELSDIYSQLIAAFKKLDDVEKTSFYQTKYISLRDRIFNEQLATNLMKIQAEHLEKENKSKIEAQNKILALNEEVMLRQKYLNVFVGIVAALLFALAFMLYRSNRQKQKVNLLLDNKVKERTRQLESSRNFLQRACDERDALMSRTAVDVKQAIVTLKGLCVVGSKDIDAVQTYFEKVNATSDAIFDTVIRLAPPKNDSIDDNVPIKLIESNP